MNYRSLHIALCKFPFGRRKTASGCTKIQPPGLGRSAKRNSPYRRASPRPPPLLHPLQSPNPKRRRGRVRHEQDGSPPAAESGQKAPRRAHDFSPLPSLQCALCFLFLCFLSFFLLAHLEQNHCISSGGAVVIPTQGLGRTGKHRLSGVT